MGEYVRIDHGFDPVVDERCRVLVLGSFPSVLSRENAFYYGNPRNRFWHVIAACAGEAAPPEAGEARAPAGTGETHPAAMCDFGDGCGRTPDSAATAVPAPSALADPVTLAESIAAKRDLLLRNGIALWDVVASCEVKGSSDASIRDVVPARIERVTGVAHIAAVFCNGGTAARLYRRYLRERVGLDAVALPSTSPANASWSLERLEARWREALGPYL